MMLSYPENTASPRRSPLGRPVRLLVVGVIAAVSCGTILRAADPIQQSFAREVQPILDQYCYDCHGNGSKKGGISLEEFDSVAALHDQKLWPRALKNLRTGIMPPADKPRPSPEEVEKMVTWIKREALSLDPVHPDPGRVTVRRLNRVEYRNTIRELMGVDFDTEKEFPPDDTGRGFDNIGDVLSISPMLLEKYLDAAQAIIAKAVPTHSKVVAEQSLTGKLFAPARPPDAPAPVNQPPSISAVETSRPFAPTQPAPPPATPAPAATPTVAAKAPAPPPVFVHPAPVVVGEALELSYYTPVTVTTVYKVPVAGKYQVAVNLGLVERYVDDQFDYNKCRLIFKADGQTLFSQDFTREGDGKIYDFSFDRNWAAGDHILSFEAQPLGPEQEQKRLLRFRLNTVTVHGPFAKDQWVQPKEYAHYFPKPVPRFAGARRRYARELLASFATRAYRRPADEATVTGLTAMAERVAAQPGNTFEAGVAQAMVAVLASPRFIFREEGTEPLQPGQVYPPVDEYALASRLSYFLWSTMPDAELFRLAGEGKLRAYLPVELERMMKDPRAMEFVRNFTGQWLQARDIATVQINNFAVYLREHPDSAVENAFETFRKINEIPEDKRTPEEKTAFTEARTTFRSFFRTPKPQFSYELRTAMRRETEMVFDYILKEDRSLIELIESDYTFLNEDLAKHYGIAGITGPEMRKVTLAPDSPRGGILTQGTVLAVTSNPTRTSPVKRGVFILDAILGTRPPPPPPNIPALEDAASKEKLRELTLRETLALHAKDKMCASCHSRMDPPGLALENFNAMGMWRDSELNRPIEPGGKLITGETFANIRELKHILATKHRRDFYYNLSEKLLTYALGRGLEYYDIETLDQLVAQLEASGGRYSALLKGIVNSAPFQQCRPNEVSPIVAGGAGTSPEPIAR